MMNLVPIYALCIFFILVIIAWMKKTSIRKWIYRLNAKLQVQSLREAIINADNDKSKTGRKNIVVYNTDTRKFESAKKKILKAAARVKDSKPVRDGFRQTKSMKMTSLTAERVHQIEKKSPYVTK